MSEPRFTDAELRADLEAGRRPVEIAAKYGVSKQAVSQRVKRLGLTTAAQAAMVPAEAKRYVSRSLDAMEELTRSLHRTNLLQDACDAWLRDADDPEKYDVGPRTGDVDITYAVEIPTQTGFRYEKRKKSLAEILAVFAGNDDDGARFVKIEKGEWKHSDPRDLILKTSAEVRQTISTAAELAKCLADVRAMQMLREAILLEIRRADPDTAERLVDAVRRATLVHGVISGPGSGMSSAG